MIIETSLLIKDTETVEGLLDGTQKRYGSTIKKEKSTEFKLKFLIETPKFTEQIKALPFSPLLGGGLANDVIDRGILSSQLSRIDRKFGGIEKTLSSVLDASQIAAGASVLNLGVSIAGFTYMGYKLNQIQTSLGKIQQSMEVGFDCVEDRLDKLSGQLVYLHLLVEDNRLKQQNLAEVISNLQRTIFLKEISDLAAELLNLNRFPTEVSTREAIKIASRVRIFLSNQATQISPELETEIILNSDLSIQGWAVATAVEANLMLGIGEIQQAKELLKLETSKFREVALRWATKLLDDEQPQLATTYRFIAPCFQDHIKLERITRIVNISQRDRDLSPEEIRRKKNEVEVEFEMSHSSQRYNKYWMYRQLVIAEYLDALSELSARLDSLYSFADLCERQNVKSSKEILSGMDTELALYVVKLN